MEWSWLYLNGTRNLKIFQQLPFRCGKAASYLYSVIERYIDKSQSKRHINPPSLGERILAALLQIRYLLQSHCKASYIYKYRWVEDDWRLFERKKGFGWLNESWYPIHGTSYSVASYTYPLCRLNEVKPTWHSVDSVPIHSLNQPFEIFLSSTLPTLW